MSENNSPLSKKTGQASQVVRQKVREFFFENPSARLTVRELARKLKINRSTVQYHLKNLRKEGMTSKDNQWIDNWFNRLLKTNYYLEKISRSGLIDFLEQELGASAVVLFGSFRKGESVSESDIDLFVECAKDKKLNLDVFERKLGHKIQLFTRQKITMLPDNLLNNVVNGIKIKGYFTLK